MEELKTVMSFCRKKEKHLLIAQTGGETHAGSLKKNPEFLSLSIVVTRNSRKKNAIFHFYANEGKQPKTAVTNTTVQCPSPFLESFAWPLEFLQSV
jgi:hypothetical protein